MAEIEIRVLFLTSHKVWKLFSYDKLWRKPYSKDADQIVDLICISFVSHIWHKKVSPWHGSNCFQPVCCPDGEHCCQSGTTCDPTSRYCHAGDQMFESLPKIPARRVDSVICPDGKSECPTGDTCCVLPSGKYGCCPFPNVSEPQHDKTNKISVRPAKTQISLGIRSVWSVFAVRSTGS